ncbi:phosphatases II, partial [Mollisia scopiformis]
ASISEIRPRLFLGNLSSILDPQTVRNHNIKAGISLIGYPLKVWSTPEFAQQIPQHSYFECFGYGGQDILKLMSPCCDLIDQYMSSPGGVVVHCVKGWSRSASMVIAYVMRRHRRSWREAGKEVLKRREICPNTHFLEQLRVWEEVEYNIWEDEDSVLP